MAHSLHSARSWSQVERRSSLEVFLLGQIDYRHCMALQKRIVEAAYSRAGGAITLLVCEHPPIITQGQASQSDDIDLRGVLYAGHPLDVLSVRRGGGVMLHLPGQLAIYPIVPLEWHAWSVGEYLARFTAALQDTLAACAVRGVTRPGRQGLWGRSGQLVSIGVAVERWITSFGALVHLLPSPPLTQYLCTDRPSQTRLGSLQQEAKRCVPMSHLRSRVVRCVADRFGCEQHHVYTGHPLLERIERGGHAIARAS